MDHALMSDDDRARERTVTELATFARSHERRENGETARAHRNRVRRYVRDLAGERWVARFDELAGHAEADDRSAS